MRGLGRGDAVFDAVVRGPEELGRAMAKSVPEAMQPALRRLAEHGKQAAQGKSKSQMVSGSLMAEAGPLRGRVWSELHPLVANVLESGRKAGRKAPPVAVIEGWAPVGRGDAFAIARAIGRRGIRGRFFMRAGWRAVNRLMPEALGEAAAAWEARVQFNAGASKQAV